MARVVNQTRNNILTITGGVIGAGAMGTIEDWEAPILVGNYGKKVTVLNEPKAKKKSK